MDRQAVENRPDLAIFLPSLHVGGTERTMAGLATGIASFGFRVDLVLCSAEGHYLAPLPDSIRIVDLTAARVLSSVLPLASYLRRSRPCAMLSALTHANVIAMLASLTARTDTRFFLSERSNLSQATRDTTSLRERLLPHLCSLLYNRAERVICVSQGVADDLAANHRVRPDKLVTIPNPVDAAGLLHTAATSPAADIDEFKAGRHLIVSVGRLDPAKDHATLIAAVKLAQRSWDLCLAIIGDGALRDDLVREIGRLGMAGSVRLVGFDPAPARWMARCDVYAHSSRREGFPNALVEAMACGAPVVATDCPSGPREILDGGKWGRLVPVGDPVALAAAICATLESGSIDATPQVRRFARDTVISSYIDTLGLAREL